MNRSDSTYLSQIDIIKALAIFCVIILHSFDSKSLNNVIGYFLFNQAVPIFCILLGYNFVLSMKKRHLLSFSLYLKVRFRRILFPFILVFIGQIIILAFLWFVGIKKLAFSPLYFIGMLPISGPGNYFISLLFQFIILAPFWYKLYQKNKYATFVLSYGVSFAFEIISVTLFSQQTLYLYNACIVRYLVAITLGFWLVDNKEKLGCWFSVGIILSVFYIFSIDMLKWKMPFFRIEWVDQNFISFLYPAFLIVLGIQFLPKNSVNKLFPIKLLMTVGKLSFHIFLVQICYFSIAQFIQGVVRIPLINLTSFFQIGWILNIGTCILFGYLFMLFSEYVASRIFVPNSNFMERTSFLNQLKKLRIK